MTSRHRGAARFTDPLWSGSALQARGAEVSADAVVPHRPMDPHETNGRSDQFGELFESFKKGDRWAQREVWRTYRDTVRASIERLLSDAEGRYPSHVLERFDPEDAEQETCRVLLSNRRHGTMDVESATEAAFLEFLFRITSKTVHAMLDCEAREVDIARDVTTNALSGRQFSSVQAKLAEKEDLKNRFQRVLASLPPRPNRGRDLLIFTLVFWDGLTIEQAARIIPERPTQQAVRKAFYRLRKEIEKRLVESGDAQDS